MTSGHKNTGIGYFFNTPSDTAEVTLGLPGLQGLILTMYRREWQGKDCQHSDRRHPLHHITPNEKGLKLYQYLSSL
jgi:hypothetical protein